MQFGRIFPNEVKKRSKRGSPHFVLLTYSKAGSAMLAGERIQVPLSPGRGKDLIWLCRGRQMAELEKIQISFPISAILHSFWAQHCLSYSHKKQMRPWWSHRMLRLRLTRRFTVAYQPREVSASWWRELLACLLWAPAKGAQHTSDGYQFGRVVWHCL